MILIPCCCSFLKKMMTWRLVPGLSCGPGPMRTLQQVLSCGPRPMMTLQPVLSFGPALTRLLQLGHSVWTEPRFPSSDLTEVLQMTWRKLTEQFSAGHSVSALPQVLKLTCSVQPGLIFARLQVSALPQVLKLTCSGQPMALISE